MIKHQINVKPPNVYTPSPLPHQIYSQEQYTDWLKTQPKVGDLLTRGLKPVEYPFYNCFLVLYVEGNFFKAKRNMYTGKYEPHYVINCSLQVQAHPFWDNVEDLKLFTPEEEKLIEPYHDQLQNHLAANSFLREKKQAIPTRSK